MESDVAEFVGTIFELIAEPKGENCDRRNPPGRRALLPFLPLVASCQPKSVNGSNSAEPARKKCWHEDGKDEISSLQGMH